VKLSVKISTYPLADECSLCSHFSFSNLFWGKIVKCCGTRHFPAIPYALRAKELKSEVNKRLEVGRDGLVDDEDHKGAEDGLEVNGGGDEQVHGLFLK
jgi:hypothetical protein